MAAGGAQVVRDFGPQSGGWLQCADAQGTFYFNSQTKQSSDEPPPELMAFVAQGGGGPPQGGPPQGGKGGMSQPQGGPPQGGVPPQQQQQMMMMQQMQAAQAQQAAAQGGAPQPQVLQDLGGGWLQCKDAQGVFYYNSQTKQSRDDPPPELLGAQPQQQPPPQAGPPGQGAQAFGQPQIIAELPGNWLKCQDAQGFFYHNSVTKQSLDQPPPELAAYAAQGAQPQQVGLQQKPAPQATQAQPQVEREFPGGWLQCKDAQGIFYYNTASKQTLETPPPEIAQFLGGNGPPQPPGGMSGPPGHYGAQASQAAQAAEPQARLTGQIGVWQILEDAQGEFYCNSTTRQTFDQPPPELLQIIQQQKQGGMAQQAPQGMPPQMGQPGKGQFGQPGKGQYGQPGGGKGW